MAEPEQAQKSIANARKLGVQRQPDAPRRLDFTRRFMERETGTLLFRRTIEVEGRNIMGFVGKNWTAMEMTISILEQNNGYAHVSYDGRFGYQIDWLITPEGKKIGNDRMGGLQCDVNNGLPFVIFGGKVVWLNADNLLLKDEDRLRWKYDPYTQEMPDILQGKGGGGCAGGKGFNTESIRVMSFGGYDPLAGRISMLPIMMEAERGMPSELGFAPNWLMHLMEHGLNRQVPEIQIVDAVPGMQLQLAHSYNSRMYRVRRRRGMRARREESLRPEQMKKGGNGMARNSAAHQYNVEYAPAEAGKEDYHAPARKETIHKEVEYRQEEARPKREKIPGFRAEQFDAVGLKRNRFPREMVTLGAKVVQQGIHHKPAKERMLGDVVIWQAAAPRPRKEATAISKTKKAGFAVFKERRKAIASRRMEKEKAAGIPEARWRAAKRKDLKASVRRRERSAPKIIPIPIPALAKPAIRRAFSRELMVSERMERGGERKTRPAADRKEERTTRAPARKGRARKRWQGGVHLLLMQKERKRRRRSWLSISRR
ncbi:hypothetical protein H0O01_02030 [Candidatus Micrarchaeota archaeon]|nr:hypothetical protein [Candidatus Micrarchaeota archaeon]